MKAHHLALVAALSTSSCAPDTLAQLTFDDAALGALTNAQARITFTDDDGEHPRATANDLSGPAVDVPLACRESRCSLNIAVPAGSYAVAVVVSSTDRCGTRADVLRFEGRFESEHWQTAEPTFKGISTAFDADDDGVIDVLEATTCARFDIDDGEGLPRLCDADHASCCVDEAGLSGGQMSFPGRDNHVVPYDRDGDAVDDEVAVAAFALDSTEFTYGALARCVAAGVCLAGAADHPARVALADGIDPRLPVQGLTPSEASTACGYFGRRLPRDAEWDFAAADRGEAPRGRYPFDVEVDVDVGCTIDDPAPAAAYRAAGRDCGDAEALPVGSFATSAITRGVGTPVSEMAGNVAEWTVIGDADTPDDDGDGVPDGVDALVLRGGSASGFVELLENDFVVLFDSDDFARVADVSAVAGFRCASDVVVASEEPVCPNG